MPDGSKRPVKFDGIQADFVIDRKLKVVDAPHARAQLLRQSQVLEQHRLTGTWEFPTPVQKAKAEAAEKDEGDQHQSQGGEAMIAMQVARIIAQFMVFLNLTNEDLLDIDASVDAMQDLAEGLESLDRSFLRELVDAFPVIASEFGGAAQQVVRNIAHSFYLEEALAVDDPGKLAELEALRDARD